MEVEKPEIIRRTMETSRAQSEWNKVMDSILEDGNGEIWLDEVYILGEERDIVAFITQNY